MTTTATTPDIRTQRPVELHAGCRFTWHVTAGDTGGAFCLAEAVVPAGCEPPLHIHAREEESFYVLDGKVTFQRGMWSASTPSLAIASCCPAASSTASPSTHQPRACSYWPPRARSRTLSARPRPRSTRRTTRCGRRRAANRGEAKRLIAAFSAQGVEFTGPPLPVLLAQEG